MPVAIREMLSVVKSAARVAIGWFQAFALLPIVVIVVAVRPFVLIRFGVIDASRIGHLCNTQGYLCLRDIERSKRRILDFIGCSTVVCNQQLKAMIGRALRIFPGMELLRCLGKSCQLWTGSNAHCLEFRPRDIQFLDVVEQHLHFTEDEQEQGRRLLERLCIPVDARWVCLHNRDSAYLDKAQPGRDWSYHSFRDFNVQSMQLAADELANRGYYVLRMGSSAEQSLISSNPRVIDYANHVERNDFADIYLLGNCHFYLGSDSGIFAVSAIFKRPFAFINFPVPEPTWSVYHWNPFPFILKRIWHKEKGRLLSLREVFEAGLANCSQLRTFEMAGVELVANSPEEIRDLAVEVDDRIKSVWCARREDEELQQRFWAIFDQCSLHNRSVIKARIGSAFLREHADLLD